MANTREVMGERACLDALVANTLTSFEDDEITRIGGSCLRYHTALTDVTLSQCKSVNNYGLSDCDNLQTVDILGTGTFGSGYYAYAFNGSTSLSAIIIRGSTKTTIGGSGILDSTMMRCGDGAVYVSQDAASAYASDTLWNMFIVSTIDKYPLSVFETVSDSWSEIAAASANGTYDNKYEIGDVKSIVIDGTTYYMQLVAKDADVLASDGTTTVPMTWLMYRRCYGTLHRMNPANSSGTQGTGGNGGWEHSEMRSWLNDTVLPLLPSDVRSSIKEVRKYSDYVVPGETTVTHDQVTADKLWIPSRREVFGGTSGEQNGPVYLASNPAVVPVLQARIRYSQPSPQGRVSLLSWHTRSTANAASYYTVYTEGDEHTSQSATEYGVCFGFCI